MNHSVKIIQRARTHIKVVPPPNAMNRQVDLLGVGLTLTGKEKAMVR